MTRDIVVTGKARSSKVGVWACGPHKEDAFTQGKLVGVPLSLERNPPLLPIHPHNPISRLENTSRAVSNCHAGSSAICAESGAS